MPSEKPKNGRLAMRLHSLRPGRTDVLTWPGVSPQDSTEACVCRAGAGWPLLTGVWSLPNKKGLLRSIAIAPGLPYGGPMPQVEPRAVRR